MPLRAVTGSSGIGKAGDLSLLKSVSPTSETRGDHLWSLVKCSKNYWTVS